MSFRLLVIFGGLISTAYGFERSAPTGTPLAWADSCVSLALNSSGSDDIEFTDVEDTLLSSLGSWNELECGQLVVNYQGLVETESVGFVNNGENVNVVVFRDRIGSWVNDPDILGLTTLTFCSGVGGDCYFNGQILDGDVELNGNDMPFSIDGDEGQDFHDLENTLTHELGHFIGLDHSLVQGSTMYASAPPGEIIKRSLAQDDVNGYCSIYALCEPLQRCDLCAAGPPRDLTNDDPEMSRLAQNSSSGGCTITINRCNPWLFVSCLFGLVALQRKRQSRCLR